MTDCKVNPPERPPPDWNQAAPDQDKIIFNLEVYGKVDDDDSAIYLPVTSRPRSRPDVATPKHLSAFHPPFKGLFPQPQENTGKTNILVRLTVQLGHTFSEINHGLVYNKRCNPRRALTKPSTPAGNSGRDNIHENCILYANDLLGDRQRYKALELLGTGTFGQVVKVRDTKTAQLYAVKVIKNKRAYYKQSQLEARILNQLNTVHDPNDAHHLVRLYGTFMHQHHLCLVFELLSINLYELTRQHHFRGFSARLVRVFASQIADALVVLASAGVIHCDLKPENILLTSLNSPNIKVADFGSALHQSHAGQMYIQSRFYRSPEVLLGAKYSRAIDMWSFGCVVAELFLGIPLFPGSSEYNQLERIIETIGLPPPYLIKQGQYAMRYFNTKKVNGHVTYTLKPRQQYAGEQGRNEKPNKPYFRTTDLARLILDHPKPRRHMSPEEVACEMKARHHLVDFLFAVLQVDPLRRLTPPEAKHHSFLKAPLSVSPPRTFPSSCSANESSSVANACICSVSQQQVAADIPTVHSPTPVLPTKTDHPTPPPSSPPHVSPRRIRAGSIAALFHPSFFDIRQRNKPPTHPLKR